MSGGRQPVVHIVDDDEAVRSALSLLANAHGWGVRAFDSAAGYLEADPEVGDRPAVLILDLQMPGMNGAHLQEVLASQDRHIPTIVLTAWPEGELADRARAAGANAVLAKPFDPSEWLRTVKEVIENSA